MYKTRDISYYKCYSVSDIAIMLEKSEKTILKFIADGLAKIDNKKLFLVRGSALSKYLKDLNDSRKHPLDFNEFYCLSCREGCIPQKNQITLAQGGNSMMAKAVCPECGKVMNRPYKIADYGELKKIFAIVEKLCISDSDTSPLNFQIDTPADTPVNGTTKGQQLCLF